MQVVKLEDTLQACLEGKPYHQTRVKLTVRKWTDNHSDNGFDVIIETTGKNWSKREREGCLRYTADNLSISGLRRFVAYCGETISADLPAFVETLIAKV